MVKTQEYYEALLWQYERLIDYLKFINQYPGGIDDLKEMINAAIESHSNALVSYKSILPNDEINIKEILTW